MSRIYRVVTSPMDDLPPITEEDLILPSDFPVGGITSLQMEKALLDNQEGLYKHNYTYLCLTNGTYEKNHFYRFNISGDQFSWVHIGQLGGGGGEIGLSQLAVSIIPDIPTVAGNLIIFDDIDIIDSYTVKVVDTVTEEEYEVGTADRASFVDYETRKSIDISQLSGYADLPAGYYNLSITANIEGFEPGSPSTPVAYKKIPLVTDPAVLYDHGTFDVKLTWEELLDGDYFTYSNGTLNAGSNVTSLDGDLIIGHGVTTIGAELCCNCSTLESVVISNTVTSINNRAFSGCSGITEVLFEAPSAVTSLGSEVFSSTTSLRYIVLPDSITSMNSGTFALSGITGVKLPARTPRIGTDMFYGCPNLTDVFITNNIYNSTAIDQRAFMNCSSLRSIRFEESLPEVSIANSAFNNCTALTSLKLPNIISGIKNAFSGCTSLAELVFSSDFYCPTNSNVLIKGQNYGYGQAINLINTQGYANVEWWIDKNAATLYDPDTGEVSKTWRELESGGYLSFYLYDGILSGGTNREQLAGDLVIGDIVTKLGSHVFSGSAITSVKIPKTLKSLGLAMCYDCESLTDVIFEEDCPITELGNSAFANCSNLVNINLENIPNLTIINEHAFNDCTSLVTISIPLKVTTIGNDAFAGCSALTSVELPDGLITIGSAAFSHDDSLKSIIIPSSVTTIKGFAFYNDGSPSMSVLIVNANYSNTENSNKLVAHKNYGLGLTPSLVVGYGYHDVSWTKIT